MQSLERLDDESTFQHCWCHILLLDRNWKVVSKLESAFDLDAQIRRYLATGNHDSNFIGWPGHNFVEAAVQAAARLRDALIKKVLERAPSPTNWSLLDASGIRELTRSKVAPMVAGLFPKAEQEKVLAIVERSVVFLTPENIERVLRSEHWLHTVWSLANLYLVSIGVEPLSDDPPIIVGLSQETTCYISVAYFNETNPYADFIVHEVAHIFHNCKRATVGLPETHRREWLLDIDFCKREVFAYACEAYSCILAVGETRQRRLDALARHAGGELPSDETVDIAEYPDILADAVRSRNGWKVILRRCSPTRPARLQITGTRAPDL